MIDYVSAVIYSDAKNQANLKAEKLTTFNIMFIYVSYYIHITIISFLDRLIDSILLCPLD